VIDVECCSFLVAAKLRDFAADFVESKADLKALFQPVILGVFKIKKYGSILAAFIFYGSPKKIGPILQYYVCKYVLQTQA
jgi:hypothetical protein